MKKAEKKQGTRSSLAQSSSNKLDADPKKIFVGGFGDKITKDDLSGYFEKFGTVTDAVVCYDKLTRKARGFGFVTFDSKEAADKVLENQFHYLKGTKVETTQAKPRSSMNSDCWGHRSPANDYGGMYSPHSRPFMPWNGPYLVPYPYVYPYLYAPPGFINYGYMMSQTGTPAIQSDRGNQPPASLKSDPAKPDSNLLVIAP